MRGFGIVHFDESFVGGIFGIGRTYGAVARFEADSVETLEADWPTALQQTAEWRAHRQEKALCLHLYFIVPKPIVWQAIAFVSRKLLTSADRLPAEFACLRLEVVVFSAREKNVFMNVTLNSDATQPVKPVATA